MNGNTEASSGVFRARSYYNIDRRQLLQAVVAASGLTAAGLLPAGLRAATAINFFGWEGYDAFLEGGDYNAKAGVELQKTFISAPDEVITKLRLGSDQVDLCTPYFIHNNFLAAEGLTEPLDLDKIPNFQLIHPAILKMFEDNMTYEGSWHAAPFTYASICMAYNADEAVAPTSWTDLKKPEYKGKCAITNDPPGNLFAWGRVAGAENPHRMTHAELKKTVELLVDLKKNHLRAIAPSYGDLIDMLAKKEVIISQGWEPLSVWVEGVNIKAAYPKEKSLSYIEGFAIGKGAPNVDAAHAYINNALSVEGQLAGAALAMSVVNAEAMDKDSDLNRELYQYDSLENYFTEKTMIVPMYPLEPDGVHATWDEYQEAWEQVLKG